MNLLKMSFSGGILILVIMVIRAVAKNRLPKRAFLILWAITFLRLLIPFSVPAVFSAYSLIGQNKLAAESMARAENALGISGAFTGDFGRDKSHTEPSETDLDGDASSRSEASPYSEISLDSEILPGSETSLYAEELPYSTVPSYSGGSKTTGEANIFLPWFIIYLAGMLPCIAFLAVSYWKCLQKFRMSLPVGKGYGIAWLKEHPLKRNVSIRQSDMITAPLTYGLLRPVILMPKTTEWENEERIKYILMHEYVHIRRFDSAAKLIAAVTLCVHWFNPMVWVMYVLYNRDIELSCDESVVRAFGENSKALYANTLIYMEEKRSGLVPFYSSFSKNAIEERITAIMKIKKISVAAIVTAVVLIVGVAALFATSAKSASYEETLKEALTEIPGGEFTKEESEKLFSLWIDDYEEMPVADYREIMNKMADEPEMRGLVDRFFASELVYEIKDDEEAKAMKAFTNYFFDIFVPLTAEKWETREIEGYAIDRNTDVPVDSAVFEYRFSLNIVNAERLTVEEYDSIREKADSALSDILNNYTMEELCDERQMRASLDEQISFLTESLSTENLQVEVAEYYFRPVSSEMLEDLALHDEANKESEDLWEEILSPYIPFGLDWTYISDYNGGDVKMTWQGKEVRGIFDEKESIWITEHTGISTYSADAVELYAVYENGELTGLRPASPEEMADWTAEREESSSRLPEVKESSQRESDEMESERKRLIEEEREATGYPPGTEADYRSLFYLMTPGYENMSVAEFNADLLEWANENFESHERILQDAGLDNYRVNLSKEEKIFVALTVTLSSQENFRMIQSLNTGRPEEVCHSANCYMDKSTKGAWCSLWYRLEYRIMDKKSLKVKERDQCIAGIQKEVDALWEETDLEQFLLMSEEDVAEQLNAIAASYSNDLMNVTITENDIQFEKMDERGYLN